MHVTANVKDLCIIHNYNYLCACMNIHIPSVFEYEVEKEAEYGKDDA